MIRFAPDGERIGLVTDEADARTLTELAGQFSDLLAERAAIVAAAPSAPTDAALLRLFPDPLPSDPAESAEIRWLTEPALLDHKQANAQRVVKTLATPGVLEPQDELAWLQWLTDIRLVLAARLGIVVDGDDGRSESDDDRAMQWSYHALGSLQADLLDVLDSRETARWTSR